MKSEGCKIPRFNSILIFLILAKILIFCFFKIHFNIVLLSRPKSRSMKLSQADSRVNISTRLSTWDNFIEFCRYENFKINYYLYWSHSFSSSMWNSAHFVFLHEFYMTITSEKGMKRWTKLYSDEVCFEDLTIVTKNSVSWT
jgi:hypothetical protein